MKKHIPVILLLVLLVFGCKLPSAIRDMTSGGTSKGSGTATGGSDPREDIVQASKKFIDLPSFTARMEGVGDTPIKSQVSYAAPDRYHVKYLSGAAGEMEIIFIGNDMFMKSNGKWSKTPGAGNSIPTLRDSFTEEGLKTLTDVKYEGEDPVDGKPALMYSYKNVTPVGNYPFTSQIWVGKDTGLPMKIYVEYTNGTLKNMTVNYDTETPVKIEPPIN